MSTPERAVYHGWVVVSMLLIVGALTIVAPLMIVADYDPGDGNLVITFGAFIGSFFAGRACPRRRLNEPAIAAVMVILIGIAALTTPTFGTAVWNRPDDVVLRSALTLGGLALVGALAGAFVGRMSRREPPASSPIRWVGMSVLITAGALGAGVFVLLVVCGDDFDSPTGTGLLFLGFLISALGAGYATQWAAHVRVPLAACSGAFILAVVGTGLGVIIDTMPLTERAQVFAGAVLFGAILSALSYAGARLALSHRERNAETPVVPPAQVSRS